MADSFANKQKSRSEEIFIANWFQLQIGRHKRKLNQNAKHAQREKDLASN